MGNATAHAFAGADLSANFAVTAYDLNATGLTDANSSRPNQASGHESWFTQAAVAAVPTITTHPANTIAYAGNAATFSVVTAGTGLTYQWQKDGVNIAGATTPNYTIISVVTGDAGTYRVIVTNASGTITSNGAVLTVN